MTTTTHLPAPRTATDLADVVDGVLLPAADDATWRAADERRFEIGRAVVNASAWAARAAELIQQAWDGRDDRVLGYASWDAYAAEVLAGISQIRIPPLARQSLLGALHRSGMSARASAAAAGVDQKTVRTDLATLAARGELESPETVTGRDGKSYAPLALEAAPKKAGSKVDRVIELLEAAGPAGLTGPELAKKMRLTAAAVGAILSELHRYARVRRLSVTIPDGTRDSFAVYCAREHLGERVHEGPGRRSRRQEV